MSRIRKPKNHFAARIEGHAGVFRIGKLTKKVVRCHACDGKILHRTRARASRHLHILAGLKGHDVLLLQVYPCPRQAGFHVGHTDRVEDVAQTTERRVPGGQS